MTRLALGFCGLLAAAGLLAHARVEDCLTRELPMALGVPHALDCSLGVALCDLTFDGQSGYELIIGTLGDAQREYAIRVWLANKNEAPAPFKASQTSAHWRQKPRGRARELGGQILFTADAAFPARKAGPKWGARHAQKSPTSAPARGLPEAPARRVFYLPAHKEALHDALGYAAIESVCVCQTARAAIYIEAQRVEEARVLHMAREICQVLEQGAIDRVDALFGPRLDSDGDGRLAILLTSRMGPWEKRGVPVTAFVRSADFRRDLEPPFSNRADLIYVNADLPAHAALYDVLVHELTHVSCFAAREGVEPAFPALDDWLAEGIAHAAEVLCGGDFSNLDERLALFLENPSAAPLVVPNYEEAGLWRDPGCRGATFLFLWWCLANEGPEVAARLIRQPVTGRAAVEAATKRPFAELFRSWTLAVASGRVGNLSLCGNLGRCELAGVRWHALTEEGGSLEYSLRGGCAAYIKVAAPAGAGAKTLLVSAPPGTQLTLTRRPNPTRKLLPEQALGAAGK